jgi:RNA polymerase sigma-70 factor, ECF subfamily
MDAGRIAAAIETTFTENSGRVLAALMGTVGDFSLAEDALQEAFIVALQRWQTDGIPANPGGWIHVTARRRAIDVLRRRKTLDSKLAWLINETESDTFPEPDETSIPDERLKLIFTCCHPALAPDAQIALTLRTLGGLSTEAIARAFLVPVPTMAQRLVRVKRKIQTAGIPYRVPPPELLPERLDTVLAVIYLIFNEGYATTTGAALIQHDLCQEAIRLARVLNMLLAQDATLNSSAEALGLLALLLLHDARRAARLDAEGNLVPLDEQNRQHWNHAQIDEGCALLDEALALEQPGVYQIQAAISALHAQAADYEATDWAQIATLYRELFRRQPTPVVNLNWIVAVAMSEGVDYGLRLLDKLAAQHDLSSYVPYHAARADLLRRAGKNADALTAYQQACACTQNAVERNFFERRLRELTSFVPLPTKPEKT